MPDLTAVAKSMKHRLPVLCILLAYSLMCGVTEAYSGTIRLEGGEKKTIARDFNADDVVSGRVTLVGSAINFSISDPEARIVLAFTVSGPADFQFTASTTGTYNLHFENWSPDESKSVSLNYDVQHYIFGFPQELFLLFIIVGLALIAIVVFVAMSPKP